MTSGISDVAKGLAVLLALAAVVLVAAWAIPAFVHLLIDLPGRGWDAAS